MNQLVYLEPNKIGATPFTTSKVISSGSGIRHDKIKKNIEHHKKDIERFGELTPYGGGLGGRGKESGYLLTEEQATFLITLLKNTDPVVRFKANLVKEFYLMRSELLRRGMAKTDRQPIRRELTDVIQSDPDHSRWDYKLYTDLAYKAVTGKNAAQIRKERGAPKTAVASDYMTAEEIKAVTKLEYQIAVLKEMGMDYEQVKLMILNRQVVGNISAKAS